jgi:uncharacterized protein (TIGR03000 family)
MYSVVLLMALSGGAETPAADGCNGCYGGGCYGGGCWGGGCHGGGLFSHGCRGGGLFSHGCHGGGGCHGGYGCHGGGLFSHGCHGGGGCNGGCHGGAGCNGGCHGGLFHRGGGCHGGYGCNGGCHGGAVVCNGGCAGAAACNGAPAPAPAPKKEKAKEMPGPKKGEEASLSAPATIIVSLPSEAALKVDDYVTTSTSATRVFMSPKLNPGQDFSYTLTAEIVRDGKPVVASKRITVRAGEETRVSMEFPVLSVATE